MHSLSTNLQRSEHYIGQFSATQTPANGLDLQGLRNATLYAYISAFAQGTWTFSLEHSDTINSGFVTVEDTDVVPCAECDTLASGVFYTAAPSGDIIIGATYKGDKRYVRVVATAAGTPGNTEIAVFCMSEPSIQPATT